MEGIWLHVVNVEMILVISLITYIYPIYCLQGGQQEEDMFSGMSFLGPILNFWTLFVHFIVQHHICASYYSQRVWLSPPVAASLPFFFSLSGPRVGGSGHEAHSVVPFRNFDEEMKRPGVWGGDQSSTSVAESSRDNLASLYRPPFALMYLGPFEKAKDFARVQNKWLLLNLQSTREFSSHMLNRDTWANEAVAQTIKTNFVFWQVYNDTEEGSKVCTYYRVDTAPVILVIDPVTGQKIRSWHGMVQPENLLEDLLPFLDSSPTDHHVSTSHKRPRAPPEQVNDEKIVDDEELQLAIAASIEVVKDDGGVSSKETAETINEEKDNNLTKKPNYPPLPEEPTGDRNLLCRVGIRLPDGRRLQRNFLRSDPIQLLWSFCYSQLGEAGARPFRLTHAIPGSKPLDYDNNLTFEESGLANSMISVTWE